MGRVGKKQRASSPFMDAGVHPNFWARRAHSQPCATLIGLRSLEPTGETDSELCEVESFFSAGSSLRAAHAAWRRYSTGGTAGAATREILSHASPF